MLFSLVYLMSLQGMWVLEVTWRTHGQDDFCITPHIVSDLEGRDSGRGSGRRAIVSSHGCGPSQMSYGSPTMPLTSHD